MTSSQDAEEKYQKLLSENEMLKQQIRENENSLLNQLENDLKKKDSSLKTSQEDMVRIQKRLEIFEKQNKDLKAEIDKLKNNEYAMLELQNEYKGLKSENKTYKDKITKLQAKVKSWEEIKFEFERLKKTHSELEDEKKELKVEIKETRGLLEKRKEENYVLKNKILEVEKDLEYSKVMKIEIEALKKNNSQANSAEVAIIEDSKRMIEKENQILKLQLQIKTLEAAVKDVNDDMQHKIHELENEHKSKISKIIEHNDELEREKEIIIEQAHEQERLMTTAMTSFFFDNLQKQKIQEQTKTGQVSFLAKLRNVTYKLN